MSKKIVIKADLVGRACISHVLSVVATLKGIKSIDVDAEKCTLTVVGTIDPVCMARKLKKKCFAVNILSVEDDKPKPKPPAPAPAPPKVDPSKEACEKLCKEKCDKIACCKDCKDRCKETCERRCKAWLETGCCSCYSNCNPSYSYPYPYPYSYCYPYSYSGCSGGGWPWP